MLFWRKIMAKECKKTYVGFKEFNGERRQIEVTKPTKLLDENGNLLVKGAWARHNLFEYDRAIAKPQWRGKEWDFYQFSDGRYMVQISMANISIGGYASANLVDISDPEHKNKVISSMGIWLGGKNKHPMPDNCDQGHPNTVEYNKGKFHFRAVTTDRARSRVHGAVQRRDGRGKVRYGAV